MPDYYNGVYEMEKLLKAQGVSIGDFSDEKERVLLNQFIAKADEKGISIFENQYHIVPDQGDSLEVRRQRLLMRVLPPQPITFRFLQNLFKSLQIPANLSVDHAHRKLNVISFNGALDKQQQRLITVTLNSYLPANMGYIYQTWYKVDPALAYVGSAVRAVATTSTTAEVLDKPTIRRKLYEYGIWGVTPKENGAYVGTRVTSKVRASVEAERR